jgi:hypothetical protein
MFDLSWIDLVILILASFRITHLLVFDKITTFIRKPFISVVYEEDDLGQIEEIIQPKGTGLRYFIGSLLSCYWCTGKWVSLAVVAVYFYVPMSYPILIVFAVAGAAAIIESKV